jgi:hypothetical protein
MATNHHRVHFQQPQLSRELHSNNNESNRNQSEDETESVPEQPPLSSKNKTVTNRTDEEAEEVRNLAAQETRYVLYWKLGVVITIVVIATLVCVGTFILLRNKEYDDYLDSVRAANSQ